MHRYFHWFGHNFGINLRYFIRLCLDQLGFSLLGFWLQTWACRAKCKEKVEKLRPNQVKRGCKRGSINPGRMIQGKTRSLRQAQNAAFEKQGSVHGQSPPRPTHGGCHGRGSLVSPGFLRFPSRPFVSHVIFRFLSCFPFKRGWIWLHLGGRFHR